VLTVENPHLKIEMWGTRVVVLLFVARVFKPNLIVR